MYKSKSDIVRIALASMALIGCDSMRVPEPVSTLTPLRPAIMAMVVPGRATSVSVSRPLTDEAEFTLDADWFDRAESRISVVDPSNRYPGLSRFSFTAYPGLRASSYFGEWPEHGVYGLRGVLKWNASTPFSLAEGNTVVDSFDLRPEFAEPVKFQSGMIRGDLDLRWPKLASARPESLMAWSRSADSVRSFLNDWKSLCLARGLVNERVMVLNQLVSSVNLQWRIPDTAFIRAVMLGLGVPQTVFAIGDTIWLPRSRDANIYLGLSIHPEHHVWGTATPLYVSETRRFAGGGFTNNPLDRNEQDGVARFIIGSMYSWMKSSEPMRLMLEVATTCPSVLEWHQYGSTDRMHRSRGNVAPFDGYFCQLSPDTVSFPRGDVTLVPLDTLITPKTVVVVPNRDTTGTINLKANP